MTSHPLHLGRFGQSTWILPFAREIQKIQGPNRLHFPLFCHKLSTSFGFTNKKSWNFFNKISKTTKFFSSCDRNKVTDWSWDDKWVAAADSDVSALPTAAASDEDGASRADTAVGGADPAAPNVGLGWLDRDTGVVDAVVAVIGVEVAAGHNEKRWFNYWRDKLDFSSVL